MRILRRLGSETVQLLWNRSEQRLRTPVRLILAVAILYLLNLLSISVWRWLGLEAGAYGLGHYLRMFFAVTLAVLLARILLDRQRPAWFGRRGLLDIGVGTLIGGLAMTLLFLLALAAGWVQIQTTFKSRAFSLETAYRLLVPLLIFICVGFYEELLMRGYLLPNLAQGLNWSWLGSRRALAMAWLLTSVGFGLAHAWNPNASVLSTVLIAAAGLMLGLGPILTGKLGLAVGLHIAWNWFQGTVFGFAVSGAQFGPESIVTIRLTGPALWTGGAFGPEAGLLGAVAILAAVGMILAWVRWRHGRLAWHLELASKQ